MLELPESNIIANQLNKTIVGKKVSYVIANQSPHSFAWYFNNPEGYDDLLSGKTIGMSYARGAMVEIVAEECRILIGDGANLRYLDDLVNTPKKHQLYIEFDDNTALVATVQMYGGLWVYRQGENDNKYYHIAVQKPSPYLDIFDYSYFCSLRTEKTEKLSAKAFLATEQRIPGLGNGTLQDILYLAGIHPKRKMNTVTNEEYKVLFQVIKDTLKKMLDQGGRDTEKDLFGNYGSYMTYLSKKTAGMPCPKCGYELHKGTYLGGTIYYCNQCQK